MDPVSIGLGALGVGFGQPLNGLVMAHAMNGLNSLYQTIRYDKGLKYSMIFLNVWYCLYRQH